MSEIYIDEREGSKRLINHEPLRGATLCRLDSADVAFPGNGPGGETYMVGIEVKSIYDLISSMNTGRLQATQVPAMLEQYQVRWLLYYGIYQPGSKGQLMLRQGKSWKSYKIGSRIVPYGYIESFLFDLTEIGINVRHVGSESEAAHWIACLYRWWSKPWDAHKGMRVFDRSGGPTLMPNVPREVMMRAQVARGLPGLGFERALAAAEYFGSIEEMINATAKQWEEVPGIGRVIAKAVYGAIRGE